MDDTSFVLNIPETPPGDMVIRVGKLRESKLVRVHSLQLKLASKVFETMLGQHFAEGSKTYTEKSPLVLDDDDPTAFIDLCQIIHHSAKIQETISLPRLAALAVVVDKYDCIDTTKPWFLALLQPFLKEEEDFSMALLRSQGLNEMDVMCIAYILKDNTTFSRVSKWILSHCDLVKLPALVRPQLLEIMPAGVLEHLRQIRNQKLQKLETSMETQILGLWSRYTGDALPCHGVARVSGMFYFAMHQLKAGKGSLDKTSMTIDQACTGARRVAEKLGESDSCRCPARYCIGVCPTSCGANIRTVVEKLQKGLKGLCLRCTVEGAFDTKKACKHEASASA